MFNKVEMKKIKLLEDVLLLLTYIIIIGCGLVFCLSCYDKFILPKQVLFQIVLSFSFILWLFKVIAEEKITIKSGIICPIFLLIVINLVSVLFARSFYLSWQDLVFIISLVALFIILVDILNSEVRIEGVVNIISVVCVAVCIVGMLQFWGIDITGVAKRKLVEADFLSTTFGYRNYLGEYLGVMLPLFFLLSLGRKYFVYLSVLCLVTLVLLQSRAVWIGTFVSFLFIFFVSLKYLKGDFLKQYLKKIFLLSLFLIFVFTSIFLLSANSSRITNLKERALSFKTIEGSSLEERFLFWRVAAVMFKESPLLGIGGGNFKLQYLNYYEKLPLAVKIWAHNRSFPRQHPYNVHNEFLQILSETGILGLFAFLWIGTYLFSLGFSLLKNENISLDYKILTVGILAGFISLSICAFFGFPLHIPQTAIILVVLSAVLVNIKEKEEVKNIPLPITSPILKFLLVLLLPFLLYYFTVPIISSYYFEKGMKLQYKGKYKEAISIFDKAIYYNPHSGKIYFYRAVAKRSTGDHQGSVHDFLKARQTVEDIVVRFNIAAGFVHIGDFKNAEKEYLNILNINLFPEYQSRAHYELYILYEMMKEEVKSKYHKNKFLKVVENGTKR